MPVMNGGHLDIPIAVVGPGPQRQKPRRIPGPAVNRGKAVHQRIGVIRHRFMQQGMAERRLHFERVMKGAGHLEHDVFPRGNIAECVVLFGIAAFGNVFIPVIDAAVEHQQRKIVEFPYIRGGKPRIPDFV